MPRKRTPMSKHWCFTINNPTPTDAVWTQAMDYMIIGDEVGLSGTPHYQGYVVFKKRKRITTVKAILPNAHLEIMEGTPQQASNYCKKDGAYREWGQHPKTARQGAAANLLAKWEESYAHAINGDFGLIRKDMLIKFYAAYKRIRQDNPTKPPTLDVKRNFWIVAPSGYGKSTYAREQYPDYYDKAPNKWFVGYKGQTTMLCDDFGPDQCQYLGWYFKRWADNFSFPVETKGGGMEIRPQHIIVTSQYQIDECFHGLVLEALLNRFQVIELETWQVREARKATALAQLRTDESLDEEEDLSREKEKAEDTNTTIEYSDESVQLSDDEEDFIEPQVILPGYYLKLVDGKFIHTKIVPENSRLHKHQSMTNTNT